MPRKIVKHPKTGKPYSFGENVSQEQINNFFGADSNSATEPFKRLTDEDIFKILDSANVVGEDSSLVAATQFAPVRRYRRLNQDEEVYRSLLNTLNRGSFSPSMESAHNGTSFSNIPPTQEATSDSISPFARAMLYRKR